MNDITEPKRIGREPPPPHPPAANVLRVGPVTIFACLLGTAAGALVARPAAWVYGLTDGPSDVVVVLLGAASGLLAAVGWCGWMLGSAPKHLDRTGRIVWTGMLAGAAAGAAATVVLQLGFAVASGRFFPTGPLAAAIAIACGAVAGAAIGLVCGRTWHKAVRANLRGGGPTAPDDR